MNKQWNNLQDSQNCLYHSAFGFMLQTVLGILQVLPLFFHSKNPNICSILLAQFQAFLILFGNNKS